MRTWAMTCESTLSGLQGGLHQRVSTLPRRFHQPVRAYERTFHRSFVFFDQFLEILALLGIEEEEHAGDLFMQNRHVYRHLLRAHVGQRMEASSTQPRAGRRQDPELTALKHPLAAVANESGAATSPFGIGACANCTATVAIFLCV